MTRKRKEFPILENITITDVAAEGKALARVDDMVVFVPFVVPGDVVDLKIQKKKTSLLRSDSRKVPPIFSPSGRTFLPAFRSLRRLQVAVSPI